MSYSLHFPRQHCLDVGRALHVFRHGDGIQRLQQHSGCKLAKFGFVLVHDSDQKNSPQPTRARGKVPFVTREDGRRLGRAFCFRIRIGEANGDKSSVHQCFCLQVSIVRSFGSHECSEVNLFPINLNLRSERLSTLRRTANTKVSTGSVVLGRVCSVLVVELVICRAQICYAVVIAQSIDVINWETWPFSVINSPCQPMGSMALSEYADIPIALLSQYSCDVPGINTKARRYAPNNYSSFWVVLQTTSDVVYKSIQLRLFGRGLVAKHLGGFLLLFLLVNKLKNTLPSSRNTSGLPHADGALTNTQRSRKVGYPAFRLDSCFKYLHLHILSFL